MAKSENQNLQVAVIIFAFIMIALSVATFYFFNQATTNLENRVAAEEKEEKAEAFMRTMLEENQNLKENIIGVGREMKFPAVKKETEDALLKLNAAIADKDEVTREVPLCGK